MFRQLSCARLVERAVRVVKRLMVKVNVDLVTFVLQISLKLFLHPKATLLRTLATLKQHLVLRERIKMR